MTLDEAQNLTRLWALGVNVDFNKKDIVQIVQIIKKPKLCGMCGKRSQKEFCYICRTRQKLS
jgi:recombinational DNA repair protein RecR